MNTKSLLISTFVLIFVARSEKDAITYNNESKPHYKSHNRQKLQIFVTK